MIFEQFTSDQICNEAYDIARSKVYSVAEWPLRYLEVVAENDIPTCDNFNDKILFLHSYIARKVCYIPIKYW